MSYYSCTRCGKPVERTEWGYRHARLADYMGPCWWGKPTRYDHTDRFPEFFVAEREQ